MSIKTMMKYIWSLYLLLSFISLAHAQECPGGLGENLFLEGDFGSGEEFSLPMDPGIAPGYIYNRSGPPNDGEYIITNDFNQWSFVWGSWLRPHDNSNDPDGYMMVVNASFEPGLFYDEVVDGLCDNTTYEFSADILNVVMSNVLDHSDPNIDFLIDDLVVLGTGNVPKNEQWNTYSFSFSTIPGQTAVKLSLRNNAPGGRGNDLALDNISFRACGPRSEPATIDGQKIICEENYPIEVIALIEDKEDMDRSYEWEISADGGNSWDVIADQNTSRLIIDELDEGDRRYFRFATSASQESFLNEKCRFYSDTISFFTPIRETIRFDTICGGTSFDLGGALLVDPGIYTETLISSLGCDSVITIFLDTVRREVLSGDIRSFDPICAGGSDGVIIASNVVGGYPPYNLAIDDQSYAALQVDDLVAGTYEVFIEDRFDCFTSGVQVLTDPDPFIISIGEDRELILGEELMLALQSNYEVTDVIWSDPLSDFDGMTEITFLPTIEQLIDVQAISTEGCESEDGITLTLDTDVSIYIPNVFSPNNDGVEDQFFISPFGKSLGDIDVFHIYDRWGGLIWQAREGDNSWDGNFSSGNPAGEGLYSYYLAASLINGEPVRSTGAILLIR